MSVRAASYALVAVAGLVVAVASAGGAGDDVRPILVFAGAVVAAVAAGAAVELRVPGLVGGGRRHASNAGFVAVAVVYGLAVGAFWWIELDSDDDHALVSVSSTAHGYLLAAAIVATVGAAFAIGRWRAVPVLMAITFVLALALSAHQDTGDYDRTVGAALVFLFVFSLTFLGVGARQFAEDGLAPRSGRVLTGVIALLIVLAALGVAG